MFPNTSNDPSVGSAAAKTDLNGVYDASNPVWVEFNAGIDTQLTQMETRFRSYWTAKAVRAAVGR